MGTCYFSLFFILQDDIIFFNYFSIFGNMMLRYVTLCDNISPILGCRALRGSNMISNDAIYQLPEENIVYQYDMYINK